MMCMWAVMWTVNVCGVFRAWPIGYSEPGLLGIQSLAYWVFRACPIGYSQPGLLGIQSLAYWVFRAWLNNVHRPDCQFFTCMMQMAPILV